MNQGSFQKNCMLLLVNIETMCERAAKTSFFATNEYLSKIMNKSSRQIDRYLKALVKQGYLSRSPRKRIRQNDKNNPTRFHFYEKRILSINKDKYKRPEWAEEAINICLNVSKDHHMVKRKKLQEFVSKLDVQTDITCEKDKGFKLTIKNVEVLDEVQKPHINIKLIHPPGYDAYMALMKENELKKQKEEERNNLINNLKDVPENHPMYKVLFGNVTKEFALKPLEQHDDFLTDDGIPYPDADDFLDDIDQNENFECEILTKSYLSGIAEPQPIDLPMKDPKLTDEENRIEALALALTTQTRKYEEPKEFGPRVVPLIDNSIKNFELQQKKDRYSELQSPEFRNSKEYEEICKTRWRTLSAQFDYNVWSKVEENYSTNKERVYWYLTEGTKIVQTMADEFYTDESIKQTFRDLKQSGSLYLKDGKYYLSKSTTWYDFVYGGNNVERIDFNEEIPVELCYTERYLNLLKEI